MIKISLDEAYVFDMLSVLDIKLKKLDGEKLKLTELRFDQLKNEIIDQISEGTFNSIYGSDEYHDMIQANMRVFELIDESKTDNGLAKITDDANFHRHVVKTKLQKKFFNKNLTEVKNRN